MFGFVCEGLPLAISLCILHRNSPGSHTKCSQCAHLQSHRCLTILHFITFLCIIAKWGRLRQVEKDQERKEGGERMEMGCGVKKMDRIAFHNHTHLRPTLPFRFPPFPELHYKHTPTHALFAPWFTHSQNCTRCQIKSPRPHCCSQMKNLRNSGKYL